MSVHATSNLYDSLAVGAIVSGLSGAISREEVITCLFVIDAHAPYNDESLHNRAAAVAAEATSNFHRPGWDDVMMEALAELLPTAVADPSAE